MTHSDPRVLEYILWAQPPIVHFLDVGCGPGGMLDVAQSMGLVAVGIDGDPLCTHRAIVHHDYTRGPLIPTHPADLVWSVEFVEHVAAQYVPHILDTFRRGRLLFLTHATPGQGGHHHVNEQPADYWIDVLSRDGWYLLATETEIIRTITSVEYIRNTGMLWKRLASV